MRIKKFKYLQVAICCLVSALWSETKCVERAAEFLAQSIIEKTRIPAVRAEPLQDEAPKLSEKLGQMTTERIVSEAAVAGLLRFFDQRSANITKDMGCVIN